MNRVIHTCLVLSSLSFMYGVMMLENQHMDGWMEVVHAT